MNQASTKTGAHLTDVIDVRFSSGSLMLDGTLTVPQTSPGPAALLISGSGPIDRNSNSKQLAINVMGQLATHLAASEIASLGYDKRGVGSSGGNYLAAGLHDNIADARAALEALRARPEVDPTQIFVIGHSEGALIAADLAQDDRLAGAALLAGTAQNGHDLLTWQARKIASTLPKPVRWLNTCLRRDPVRTQSKRLARIAETRDDVVRMQFAKLNAKWFREFMCYEPTETLRRVQAPVLAITGSKDLQVDPADIRLIGDVVPTPFTGYVVDDISHLLRSESGAPSLRTYHKQARRPVDPGVATLVTDWMALVAHDQERAKR